MASIVQEVKWGAIAVANFSAAVVGAIGYVLTHHEEKPEKEQKPQVEYTLKVVGVTMGPENRQENIKALKPGDKITLVPHDGIVDEKGKIWQNAVAVMAGDVMLGHLPDREGPNKISMARMIRDKWRKGKDVEVIRWKRTGGTSGAPRYGLEIRIRNDR
jgi:hypothetical protein